MKNAGLPRAGHFIVDMRGWRQELYISCHAINSALLSCLTPWPNPPELLSGSSWTRVSSAEEQSITPVPFRDWGHWLRGPVQYHYLLKLLLPEVQVEPLSNVVCSGGQELTQDRRLLLFTPGHQKTQIFHHQILYVVLAAFLANVDEKLT